MKNKILGNLHGFIIFMSGCTFIGEGAMLAILGARVAFRGLDIGKKADDEYNKKKQVMDHDENEFTARSEYTQDV